MIAEILDQHADELAFLWTLRDASAVAPHHDRASLAGIDERIDAHADGLRIAGERGLEVIAGALSEGEPGSVFAAAVLAAERGSEEAMDAALALVDASGAAGRAVASAMAWVPFEVARPVIAKLLAPDAPAARRWVGIAAMAGQRRDPGEALAYATVDDDAKVKARALRAAGELGRSDLLAALRKEMRAEDEAHRFWAAWSGALLGEAAATDALWSVALAGGPFAERACAVAARAAGSREPARRLEELSGAAETARAAIEGAAALGDPASVPWLLAKLDDPALARAAGEAIATIAGITIERDLEGRAPDGAPLGPSDDAADEDVAMDRDRGLRWPKADALRSWWKARERGMRRGVRHWSGVPLTVEVAESVLRGGSQKRRASAAIEIALRKPGKFLTEVRARERAGSFAG